MKFLYIPILCLSALAAGVLSMPMVATHDPSPQGPGTNIVPKFEFPEFPEHGHSEFPEFPEFPDFSELEFQAMPRCMLMNQEMRRCFDGPGSQATQEGVDLAFAVTECLCISRWFSVEIVTECLDDGTAWNDICGADLQEQEVGLGLSVSV